MGRRRLRLCLPHRAVQAAVLTASGVTAHHGSGRPPPGWPSPKGRGMVQCRRASQAAVARKGGRCDINSWGRAHSHGRLASYCRSMDRCEGCGFQYDLGEATNAGEAIVEGAEDLAAILHDRGADVTTRREPRTWSPLEYGCHVRDVLIVQRERVLAARNIDRPSFHPMGRVGESSTGRLCRTESDRRCPPTQRRGPIACKCALPAQSPGLGAKRHIQLSGAHGTVAALGGRPHGARGTSPHARRPPSVGGWVRPGDLEHVVK